MSVVSVIIANSYSRKRVQHLKKRKKSCFWIFKKKFKRLKTQPLSHAAFNYSITGSQYR